MTSANVVEYRIFNHEGKTAGSHRQHLMCKEHWEDLLKFQPLDKHTIQAYGYDEEEEYWEGDIVSLDGFINNKAKYNKNLRESLNNESGKKQSS
jgi:hypothetical protein